MRKQPEVYAKELVDKFEALDGGDPDTDFHIYLHNKKQCALIVVEELITAIPWEHGRQSSEEFQYYQSVKNAINEMK